LIQSGETRDQEDGDTPKQCGTQQENEIHDPSPIKAIGEGYFYGRKDGEESIYGTVKKP
jgi:hypothetical protein